MKTLLFLLFATSAIADTALDQPAVASGSRVMSRDAFWNKSYREERRRNPAGTEAAWCAAADAKTKDARATRGAKLVQLVPRVDVHIYR